MEVKCPWCGSKINISPPYTHLCPECKMPILVKTVKMPDGKFIIQVVQDRRPAKQRMRGT
ncbi:MAG: hypothetical protein DRN81_02785 [Thermoproteota archaeon]|nr:MAG: hypothetical protein DRN81_02785 [Candidatus Korarchaeota archaeon]